MGQRVVDIARALLGGKPGGDLGEAARAAVARAPLPDALICLSLGGEAGWLDAGESASAAARVDLLIWEAAAGALAIPELGAWLWGDAAARARLLHGRVRGTLRERSLAARLLAVAADGLPEELPARAVDELTRTASALAVHPEPVVWIPAARALGRLAARAPGVRLLLYRWAEGARPWERRRAVTALASAPPRVSWFDEHATGLLADTDAWRAAAVGPALPHIIRERPALWAELAAAIPARPSPELAWSVAQGLAAQARGGGLDAAGEALLRALREQALAARPRSVADAQLWQVVRRDTDHLDGVDPDPGFPDVLLDRAVRDAVRIGASKVAGRSVSLARTIGATFAAQLGSAHGDEEQRAHALAGAESCARAAALALWQPILHAAGRTDAALDAELDSAREAMGLALAAAVVSPALDFAGRRAALRGLGNLVDAAAPAGPRGRAAGFALGALAEAPWVRGPAADQRRYRKPVTDLLWRVGDALRDRPGGDEAQVVGPLAAWWALSAGGLELIELLDHESPEAQARVSGAVAALRDACNASAAGASAASIGADLLRAVDDLAAGGTALHEAVRLLLVGLDAVEAGGRARLHDEVAWALAQLAEPVSWLAALRGDPAAALAAPSESPPAQPELLAAVEQAVATGTPGAAEVGALWSARVGPLLRPLLASTVTAAVDLRRTAAAARVADDRIGPYRKLRRLGSGGHSEVWLVRRDGNRRFVLKLPLRARELDPAERAAFAGVLEREATLLESLHEARVASFIDYGWDGDIPYLVLEYLVGVDLQRYAQERLPTLDELKPIIRDVCIGLRALHARKIIHRDLKPSNVFLRLQMPEGAEEFSAPLRDPAVAPVAEAVLIDFGIARLMRDGSAIDAPEGTLGFLSPEQAQASDDITVASDVYGLAATVFAALTGRRFFADRPGKTACLVAHAFERPFDDREIKKAARSLPRALRALLHESTDLDPAGRPDVARFAARFETL